MTYQDITGFETHDISANDNYNLPRTDLGDNSTPSRKVARRLILNLALL